MTHSSITDYHASLLDLPVEKGVIKTDIDGWLQPTEAHFLYKCAYESANILELGPYHGLSTSIIAQAKIDSITPQEILDKLTYASPAQLSELITIVLNANRYKSSRLGVRQTLTTKETVSRNIID